jgi:hypothetical protein
MEYPFSFSQLNHFSQFNPAASSKSILHIPINSMKMPMFSNNAAVYYKPHSFASGGVGTVRNSRAIGKKT